MQKRQHFAERDATQERTKSFVRRWTENTRKLLQSGTKIWKKGKPSEGNDLFVFNHIFQILLCLSQSHALDCHCCFSGILDTQSSELKTKIMDTLKWTRRSEPLALHAANKSVHKTNVLECCVLENDWAWNKPLVGLSGSLEHLEGMMEEQKTTMQLSSEADSDQQQSGLGVWTFFNWSGNQRNQCSSCNNTYIQASSRWQPHSSCQHQTGNNNQLSVISGRTTEANHCERVPPRHHLSPHLLLKQSAFQVLGVVAWVSKSDGKVEIHWMVQVRWLLDM